MMKELGIHYSLNLSLFRIRMRNAVLLGAQNLSMWEVDGAFSVGPLSTGARGIFYFPA